MIIPNAPPSTPPADRPRSAMSDSLAGDPTVAIICALPIELSAMRAMLDVEHSTTSTGLDNGLCTLGSIGKHQIILALLPHTGTTGAAATAMQLLNDHSSIRFGIMVGIAGGIPSPSNDIRLGDVVVSKPVGTSPGVVQFDMGKRIEGGELLLTGALNKPPRILMNTVNRLQSDHEMRGSDLAMHLESMFARWPRMAQHYSRPKVDDDELYVCDSTTSRPPRDDQTPKVFYGTIGSSNAVVKDRHLRDTLRDQNILCVEMEAAGLMDDFPCLIVRGISDYADSYKQDGWQKYAASTAAAYTKELLLSIPPSSVENAKPAVDLVQHKDVDDFLLENVNEIWEVPYEEPMMSIRHGDFYQNMKKECRENGMNWRNPDRKIMILPGDDSDGRKMLCLKFAHAYRSKFYAVFWLEGTTSDEIERQLVEQTQPYTNSLDWREAKAWIESLKRHWLLIVIDDHERLGQYKDYIPKSSGGLVLISSGLRWSEATLEYQRITTEAEEGRKERREMVEVLITVFQGIILGLVFVGFFVFLTIKVMSALVDL